MKTDIQIAQSAKTEKIANIAKKYGIDEEYFIPYGLDKAKIKLSYLDKNKKKEN